MAADCASGRAVLASGLLEVFRPAVLELDGKVAALRAAQLELRGQIESLATELQRIGEEQHAVLDLDPYVKKLMNARRRVVLVNNILQNAQRDTQQAHDVWVLETRKDLHFLQKILPAEDTIEQQNKLVSNAQTYKTYFTLFNVFRV